MWSIIAQVYYRGYLNVIRLEEATLHHKIPTICITKQHKFHTLMANKTWKNVWQEMAGFEIQVLNVIIVRGQSAWKFKGSHH